MMIICVICHLFTRKKGAPLTAHARNRLATAAAAGDGDGEPEHVPTEPHTADVAADAAELVASVMTDGTLNVFCPGLSVAYTMTPTMAITSKKAKAMIILSVARRLTMRVMRTRESSLRKEE